MVDTTVEPLMRRVDAVTGCLAAVVAAFALIEAFGLSLSGRAGGPGPGLFPALLSALLLVLGLALLVSALRVRSPGPGADVSSTPVFEARRVGRAGGVAVGLAASVAILPIAGFLLTGLLLVGYLILVVESRRGVWGVVAAVLIPGLAYLIFATLLSVRLPVGVLG